MNLHKWCWNCKSMLNVSDFNRDRSRVDGYDARCKSCKKRNYLANRSVRIEQMRVNRLRVAGG